MSEIISHTTQGVEVSVSTKYMQEYSSPTNNHYVFGYKIKIRNNSSYAIQLIHRNWEIADSCGEIREVNGEGVVGQQPILQPGETHTYTSGCNFKTTIGKMEGFYTFVRLVDQAHFDVKIPSFTMTAPFVLN